MYVCHVHACYPWRSEEENIRSLGVGVADGCQYRVVLEIEVGFSVKATNALNAWTIFLGSLMTFPLNKQNPKG